MDVRYLILSLFFLVSCMPSATVSKGSLSNSETTGGSTTSGTTGGPSTPTNLTWNYLGQLTTSITINVSNLNNAYLVGTPVETYLSMENNFVDANYCVISTYSIGGISYELRSRGLPITYYDFKAKRNVTNIRIDFQDVTNSNSFCNKTVRVKNSTGDYVVDTSTPPSSRVKYDPSLICPSCTSMLIATRVRVFKAESTSLDQIPLNYIDSSILYLQVDPNNTATGDSGSCSNNTCRARGFDCCLDNQCVKDGGVKPAAASTYPALLSTAEAERLQNPLAYLKYPQLYYICGSNVPTGGSGGGTTSGTTSGSTGGYDEAFLQLKKDYLCVEHLKSQASTSPFHNEILSRTYTPTTDCLTAASDASSTFYFQNVMKRLYTTCGCNRTVLSEMIANCPAYEYTVTTRDTQGEPIRIDCYTPPVDAGTIPTEQTVSVSSRSAPHRFFDANGIEKAPQSATSQEGDIFEYMDDGKVLPLQQELSMNAILGQMSVTLDKALPAKEVAVQLDQVYFISTTSGYFTPCPSCAKDSWLNAFTAFPSSSMGTGLQAVGHTTERDTFSTNTTAGNYEDTIFGRACWLPPTMIPYSHSAKSTTQEQRLNRLTTQAAFFVNGYQRDWFGFNKGAMIGSFDGVTWFAIGKGRIVKSSSKKLYLAINAPFADLSASTMHVVRVASYDGITQAAQVDYDPEYHQSHPYQNEAGNCQKYHMCSTDTDCITKLGWEYACADVKDLRTNWPSFDSSAAEIAATSTSRSLDQILQQKRYPSANTKRCVYRGAGSLCHTNSGGIASTDLNKRKLLTCAPNFYCANMSSGGVHNTKVSRYAAALEELPVARNHFYGKDANILGRPHDYLGTGSLNTAVRSTVIDNVTAFEPTLASNVGFCQPGKALPAPTNQVALSNPFTQQASADSQRRTDFISQIGSCNSGLFTDYRHSSCPVIGADGNYETFAAPTINTVSYVSKSSGQNACGLESLLPTASLASSSDALASSSPFRSIEAKPLNSQIIVDPTLVRDACYRRAGAVCHTDLDCSPNKMHAAQVDYFSTAFFGNLAEKNYWSEYLVCGQTDPKPLTSDPEAFKNYDMSLNRCCREVGKDITTYTSDVPTRTVPGYYDAATVGLKMTVNTGKAPNDARRYSRLATVEGIGLTLEKPALSAYQERTSSNTLASNPTFGLGTNVKSANQWKTLVEANSESCCGGGWVRKFSDGSNDWTRRDRLLYDVTNFRCINSRTPLITNMEDVKSAYSNNTAVVQSLVGLDYGDYCKDGTNTNGACAQFSVLDSFHDVWPDNTATPYATVVQVNTIKPSYASTNGDYYFKPRSADSDSAVIIDYNSNTTTARRNISIRVPSYVPQSTFDHATNGKSQAVIKMVNDTGAGLDCLPAIDNGVTKPTNPTDLTLSLPDPTTLTLSSCGLAGGCCYYYYDKTSRILTTWADTVAAGATAFDKKKVGIAFNVTSAGAAAGLTRSKPGSTAYYLKRFGLMELSGVPQITHEAISCNDNANRVVPGLFNPTIKYMTEFADPSFSFIHYYKAKNPDGTEVAVAQPKMFTNMYGLAQEPVFSANDFKCCSPLGKVVTDTSKCCSGAGVPYGTNGTRYTCAIPEGTDLMVYFNRFISNEGRGVEQPGGGLTDADFDVNTGEPLLSTAVNDKIRALGEAYCSSGTVRQGGAFGSFEPEPQGSETNLTSKIYNIVDSSRDIGQVSNAGSTVQTGYQAFMDGFRWNHHLYCDYGEQ